MVVALEVAQLKQVRRSAAAWVGGVVTRGCCGVGLVWLPLVIVVVVPTVVPTAVA